MSPPISFLTTFITVQRYLAPRAQPQFCPCFVRALVTVFALVDAFAHQHHLVSWLALIIIVHLGLDYKAALLVAPDGTFITALDLQRKTRAGWKG